MLQAAGLPNYLWAEAIHCAVYLKNRTLSSTRLSGTTPYEAYFDKKPNFSNLRVFGCQAYLHIPKERRDKFDAKANKCVMIGYSITQIAYRLWDPEACMVRIGRDVVFNELSLDNKDKSIQPQQSSFLLLDDEEEPSVENMSGLEGREVDDESEPVVSISDLEKEEAHHEDAVNDQSDPAQSLALNRPRRQTRAPIRWINEHEETYAQVAIEAAGTHEPESYDDAISSDQSQQWKAAMDDEMHSLTENKTWVLMKLPCGRQAIKCKWIYKIKQKSDGTIDRFKARLVAKGFSQKEGIDYHETYSPVVRYDSLRAILSCCATKDFEVIQLDVKTAFLHGDLNEELYMEQPRGYVLVRDLFANSPRVCMG